MVSRTKAIISLAVSSLVVIFRYFVFTDLNDLVFLSPLLILYCLGDLRNSTDMVMHHLATVALNITFGYVIYNRHYMTTEDQESVASIVCRFFEVEASTILLSLMHLGYRHIGIKLGFLFSFLYFRIYQVTWALLYQYNPLQIEAICQTSSGCYLNWYFGCITLVSLNYYWFWLIICKMRACYTRTGIKKLS